LHLIQLLEVFTLLELVSHYVNRFFSVKMFRVFRLEQIFFGVQCVQAQRVCDALSFTQDLPNLPHFSFLTAHVYDPISTTCMHCLKFSRE
jgi:hypothetical protein